MEKKKTRYVNIDLTTMTKDMNLREKADMSHIVSLSKQRGYCFASNKAICGDLGIPDRSLYRILKKLEQRGCIERITRASGKTLGKERRIYPKTDARVADNCYT